MYTLTHVIESIWVTVLFFFISAYTAILVGTPSHLVFILPDNLLCTSDSIDERNGNFILYACDRDVGLLS